jgi:hypothetical protein
MLAFLAVAMMQEFCANQTYVTVAWYFEQSKSSIYHNSVCLQNVSGYIVFVHLLSFQYSCKVLATMRLDEDINSI